MVLPTTLYKGKRLNLNLSGLKFAFWRALVDNTKGLKKLFPNALGAFHLFLQFLLSNYKGCTHFFVIS